MEVAKTVTVAMAALSLLLPHHVDQREGADAAARGTSTSWTAAPVGLSGTLPPLHVGQRVQLGLPGEDGLAPHERGVHVTRALREFDPFTPRGRRPGPS